MSYYSDQWNRFSEWKIRKYQSAYSIWGWMSKDQQMLPELRQRGLKKMNAECSPYDQIESVFYDEKAEILLKKKADTTHRRSRLWRCVHQTDQQTFTSSSQVLQ